MKNADNNKLVIIIVIIVVLVFVLKGCGGSSAGGNSSPPSSNYEGPASGSEIEDIDYDILNEFGAIPVSVHNSDVYVGTNRIKTIELIYHLSKYNNKNVYLYDCGGYRSTWTTVKDLLLDANYTVRYTENYAPLSHLWEN